MISTFVCRDAGPLQPKTPSPIPASSLLTLVAVLKTLLLKVFQPFSAFSVTIFPGLDITVNGDQTFGRFRAPVFKFVKYTAVWLHCDLQICIRDTCQPICANDYNYYDASIANPRRGNRKNKNGRNRRGADSPYGPEDWEER